MATSTRQQRVRRGTDAKEGAHRAIGIHHSRWPVEGGDGMGGSGTGGGYSALRSLRCE